jgi:hypothetical protein
MGLENGALDYRSWLLSAYCSISHAEAVLTIEILDSHDPPDVQRGL